MISQENDVIRRLQGGSFAGAVVTEEGSDLIFVKVQTQIAQRHFAVRVLFAQIADADADPQVVLLRFHQICRQSTTTANQNEHLGGRTSRQIFTQIIYRPEGGDESGTTVERLPRTGNQ